MSVEQYGIRQGGMFVAKVDIPDDLRLYDRALREACHYLDVYQQDGPVELWRRSKHRKWRRVVSRSATDARRGGA